MEKHRCWGVAALCLALLLTSIYELLSRQAAKTSGLTAQATVAAREASWQLSPEDQSQNVCRYPQITVSGLQGIDRIEGRLENEAGEIIRGEWEVDGSAARFSPYQLLSAGERYIFTGQVNDEALHSEFTISEEPMPKLWLEVSLGQEQTVYVWENGEKVQVFPCSGGLPESPSLLGIYQLKDRGESFYSARFGEGALYWVRIQDQYLFHSVPRDREGAILQEELDQIGHAASHGCIRLKDKDAKWIYDHIPKGTIVVLHPAWPDWPQEELFTKNLLESHEG